MGDSCEPRFGGVALPAREGLRPAAHPALKAGTGFGLGGRHLSLPLPILEVALPSLNSSQKRKARAKLARQKGVSESSITDAMIEAAISAGDISSSDYGSSYGSSGYDSGSSSSSSDSGSW